MRIISRELRDNFGELKIRPETLDDLWHLYYVIEFGDEISALTRRRLQSESDKIRPEKVERKSVWLSIRVEDVDFHRFSNRLRVRGKIEKGTDVGSYHTINIETAQEVSITKKWKVDQLERLDEAIRASYDPSVVILTIEEGEAYAGRVRQYGVDSVCNIKQVSTKSSESRSQFFGDILANMKKFLYEDDILVIAGPGFTKHDFLRFLEERGYDSERIKMENTSSIGPPGIQEVLRRGALDEFAREYRVSREANLMEDLLREIVVEGKAVYGYEEVEEALNYGAIETLLVIDEFIRERRDMVEPIMRKTEKMDGKVIIFSTDFEPGKKLTSLGGIAALLRFKLAT